MSTPDNEVRLGFRGELKLALMQLLYGMIEVLWYMPIALSFGLKMLGDYGDNLVVNFIIAFPFIFAAGLLFAELCRGKLAFLRFVLLAGVCGWADAYLIGNPMGGFNFYVIVVFVIYAFVGIRGCTYARKRWREIFPRGMVWLGYIFYAIAVGFYPRLAEAGDIAPIFSRVILVMGIVYVFATMFFSNVDTLRMASGGENEHVSKKHQLFNWLLVGGLTVCILLVSFMKRVAAFFEMLANKIAYGLFWLYNAITHLLMDESEGGGSGASGGMDLSEFGEMPDNPDSKFTLLFVKILGYTVIVLFVAFIIWKFGKVILEGLKKLYKKLIGSMQGNASTGGYYDTEEKLTTLKDLRKIYGEKLKNWREDRKREPSYNELTNNPERVRWIYRYYMNRRIVTGFNFSPGQTPTEALSDAEKHRASKKRGRVVRDTTEMAALYNEVRYGRPESIPDEAVAGAKKTFVKM